MVQTNDGLSACEVSEMVWHQSMSSGHSNQSESSRPLDGDSDEGDEDREDDRPVLDGQVEEKLIGNAKGVQRFRFPFSPLHVLYDIIIL